MARVLIFIIIFLKISRKSNSTQGFLHKRANFKHSYNLMINLRFIFSFYFVNISVLPFPINHLALTLCLYVIINSNHFLNDIILDQFLPSGISLFPMIFHDFSKIIGKLYLKIYYSCFRNLKNLRVKELFRISV